MQGAQQPPNVKSQARIDWLQTTVPSFTELLDPSVRLQLLLKQF